MNKFLAMILLAAALMTGVFGITACGDDSDDGDTDTTTETDQDGGDEDGGMQDAGK